ncbi:hypothetical protein DFH29DRAFT_1068506 [Suillus ampliporus]|nr:hypothetical protein DFH29DRAFT_1068506 [Suillus ampliporus]
MNPSTSSHPSSSYAAHSSSEAPLPVGNNNGFIPNPGMYMNQMPWPQPAYPQTGNATVQMNNPSFLPPNGVPAPGPRYASVAPSPNVGAADAYNYSQGVQTFAYPPGSQPAYPQPGNATVQMNNPSFLPPNAGACSRSPIRLSRALPKFALPPQQASAPLQYNQPPCPPGAFAGAPSQYQVQGVYYPNMPPPMLQSPYLPQHHGQGAEVAMGFASPSLPQTSTSSVSAGKKRAAEDCEDRKDKKKRAKRTHVQDDGDFVSFLFILFSRQSQTTMAISDILCRREGCGKIIIAASYHNHVKSAKHLGAKSADYTCPRCFMLLSRGDALKRHLKGGLCVKKQLIDVQLGWAPTYPVIGQGSMSSTSTSLGALPTAPFTVHAPAAAPSIPTVPATFNVTENLPVAPQAVEVPQAPTVVAEPSLPAPALPESPEIMFDGYIAEEPTFDVTEDWPIPPPAVEVTQAPTVNAESCPPAPASSKFPEAIFAAFMTEEAADAYLETLNPETWTMLTEWADSVVLTPQN